MSRPDPGAFGVLVLLLVGLALVIALGNALVADRPHRGGTMTKMEGTH